ncbi:MAG: phosphate ABC transporter permease PstA [Myxococcales bacterium]|nr:phosphate ABC transporter permease PstA [Myxococcales bacterium]
MTAPFRRSGRHLAADASLKIATGLATLLILTVLFLIVTDVLVHGWPKLSLGFFFESPRQGMTEGGIFPALIGTVALVLLMTVAVVPVGVATAIYLSEYAASSSKFTRAIRVAVNNLAGVPSIVFGLFGLGFFVQFVGPAVDDVFFGGEKIYAQPALIWASLTMAVLTLPVVIVATEEALRAIPRDLREASLALGATKFQTIFRVVVPQAAPGILTGTILAISRGAGEVAPIMFTGVAYFLPTLPDNLSSQFMHLGNHVYTLATQSPNVDATKPLLYATVAALLALTFALNLAAVVVRARMRRRISGAH